MHQKLISCALAFGVSAMAQTEQAVQPIPLEAAQHADWHVAGSVVYSSRTLDGSVVSKNSLSGGAFGSLIATGDSMNLDDANGAMLALAVQYKRFGIGLNYMPTTFKGSGYALAAVGPPGGGAYVTTPLETDIDIDMLLANVYYNFIQTPNSVFGVGAGFGQTAIDLAIVPGIGNALVYEGTQPFGFLNLHMQNRYADFLYGFALNGLSMEFEGADIVYSDYKVELGYRLLDQRVKLDLVGGYRMVNFAMVLEGTDGRIDTDVTVEGPYVGVNMLY